MKLYEIATEYREIQAALEESGGELTPEIEARLTGNQETLAQKMESIAKLDAEWQAECRSCLEESERIGKLHDARMGAIESLRAYALRCLQSAGIKKVETPLFVISRQANPARVVVDDEDAIPAKFWIEKITSSISKDAIKDSIKAHPESPIPGVHLETRESLRIK
ncbi:MAG TPA: siphovirus Gp157 family protein [Patescibacteria group bacterium]|nr:siphovirus Gp157 family protein [Patescibacteria group bacterium]